MVKVGSVNGWKIKIIFNVVNMPGKLFFYKMNVMISNYLSKMLVIKLRTFHFPEKKKLAEATSNLSYI